jgi:hypothetical protein
MLSPAPAGITFRDVDTSRVVRQACVKPIRWLTWENRDFYTIHTPYYDYYSFKSNRDKKEQSCANPS